MRFVRLMSIGAAIVTALLWTRSEFVCDTVTAAAQHAGTCRIVSSGGGLRVIVSPVWGSGTGVFWQRSDWSGFT